MPGLRGAEDHAPQGGAAGLLNHIASHVIMSNMGNSSSMTYGKPTGPTSYGDWKFPEIIPGEPTTIIPVAFPLTRAPIPKAVLMKEEVQILVIFFVALLIWMLPTQCINKKMCCVCFRRWMSRRLGRYFFLGLVFNVCMLALVFKAVKHVEVNTIFFTGIKLFEKCIDSLQKVLIQVAALGVLVALYLCRKKIVVILGFDQQVLKADLRDLLTGFSMKRFRPIEVSIWRAEGLSAGFTNRTLFTRVTLGYNEASHTRPHDGVGESYSIRERIQLNYDPEDDTQKMSIMIKMQEVIGAQVNQLLPAAGAIVGAVGGMASPLGPGPGAALGVVTGTGAANSVGAEVGRVDLSSTMINRIRDRALQDGGIAPNTDRPVSSRAASTAPITPWQERYFQRVDLIPQGELWIRIADVEGTT